VRVPNCFDTASELEYNRIMVRNLAKLSEKLLLFTTDRKLELMGCATGRYRLLRADLYVRDPIFSGNMDRCLSLVKTTQSV
jgi:hypothetical protein